MPYGRINVSAASDGSVSTRAPFRARRDLPYRYNYGCGGETFVFFYTCRLVVADVMLLVIRRTLPQGLARQFEPRVTNKVFCCCFFFKFSVIFRVTEGDIAGVHDQVGIARGSHAKARG